MTPPPLVLASASPRRQRLLERLGYRFAVRPAQIDETPRPQEPAAPYAARLAVEKAAAVARPGEVVLAADTVVTCGGALLGKPEDDADARRMLGELAGRWHEVLTAIAVHAADLRLEHVERTRVRFAPMKPAEIDWYVATGEARDKAGAYAIQGLGMLFVDAIDGNYSNVVGLPVPATYRLLRAAGYDLLAAPAIGAGGSAA